MKEEKLKINKKNAKMNSLILGEKWFIAHGNNVEFVRGGIRSIGEKSIFIKCFSRFRVLGKENELTTFKKNDYMKHQSEKDKYQCDELWYSLFIGGELVSYHIILSNSFLEKHFNKDTTINIDANKLYESRKENGIEYSNHFADYNEVYYIEKLSESNCKVELRVFHEIVRPIKDNIEQRYIIDESSDLNIVRKKESSHIIPNDENEVNMKIDKVDNIDESYFSDPINLLLFLEKNENEY